MAARDILQAASGATGKLYVDDVFSTYLYDGNGSTQTITNGIDLAGKGGLVWIKQRSGAVDHRLQDTTRGAGQSLVSNTTGAAVSEPTSITSFAASGFVLGANTGTNTSGQIFASWTFRNAPKFFTHTTVSHSGASPASVDLSSLGTVGMVAAKITQTTGDWYVWHRSCTPGTNLRLNTTSAETTDLLTVTGTTASLSLAAAGGTYVIYAWAHDTSTDGIIQCGSAVTPSLVNLGWEPQFVLAKATNTGGDWRIFDTARGWTSGGNDHQMVPNSAVAESTINWGEPNSSGFDFAVAAATYIYLAIRIPNKPPTSGTEVFRPVTYTGTNTDNRLVNTGIKTDMAWFRMRSGSGTGYEGFVVGDRLRGQTWLKTGAIQAETFTADGLDNQIISTTEYGTAFSSMTGVWVGNNTGTAVTSVNINANTTANNHIVEAFKRAPGFMDIVCYTGNGSSQVVSHQLGVTPEFLIVKRRSAASLNGWTVWHNSFSSSEYVYLNLSDAKSTSTSPWNATLPTSTGFTVGGFADTNFNTQGFVAYLFATLPGISKVGSYTGGSLNIDCGFTTGARFVMIKRTDATGNWWVFDTARGIIVGDDPALTLDTTTAEDGLSSSLNSYSKGFSLGSNHVVTNINVAGANYIYLAIA